MLKRMNLCNFVTRGVRNGEITAPPCLHVADEADCEKPGETFTAGYR